MDSEIQQTIDGLARVDESALELKIELCRKHFKDHDALEYAADKWECGHEMIERYVKVGLWFPNVRGVNAIKSAIYLTKLGGRQRAYDLAIDAETLFEMPCWEVKALVENEIERRKAARKPREKKSLVCPHCGKEIENGRQQSVSGSDTV